MAEIKGLTDNVKRGRLLAISIVISISIFAFKLLQIEQTVTIWQVYVKAVLYFILTYLLLVWALRGQVNKNSLLFVLPQSALLVFTQILFVELFFFQKFGRIYEAVFLFVIILILFVSTYISFLTTNIFNVSTFKQIPLMQVGKTASYILSILMVYFLTYGILESSFNPFIVVLLATISYMAIVLMHFRHLHIGKGSLIATISVTTTSMVISLLGVMLISSVHEYIALLPMTVMYAMTAVVMNKERNMLKTINIYSYILLMLVVISLNIILG